ncbi:hydroxymethylglutaryl-CoA lyase [Streptomyces malaysiensis]|uniref:hydroxymethylglutaryl-CoA lyase n=1 Tax=Streptomyces malaysiensis TaxID=92644 RepID=UPI00371635F2
MTRRDLPATVDIREVGPRDGLQLEAPLPLQDRLAILKALAKTGLRRIEATAFVSPKAVPAHSDAELLADELERWPHVEFSALVASVGGARRAVGCGVANLEYVISVSEGHSQANVRRRTADATADIAEIAQLVHQAGGQLEAILATSWDCPFDGRTPIERTVEVAQRAVALGADRICLADTIGTATPLRVTSLIHAVREAIPDTEIAVHFHNTRGSGLACSLAAVQAGVTQLDASVGGLGGCPFAPGASGNIATEELIYMLEESGVHTGVDLDTVLTAAALVERAVGHQLQSNLFRATVQT